jgi:Domain of unknown function (DUF397)
VKRTWHKSSHSGDAGNCVEICTDETAVAVRDSKNTAGPELQITGRAWSAFVAGIKHGEFNL